MISSFFIINDNRLKYIILNYEYVNKLLIKFNKYVISDYNRLNDCIV